MWPSLDKFCIEIKTDFPLSAGCCLFFTLIDSCSRYLCLKTLTAAKKYRNATLRWLDSSVYTVHAKLHRACLIVTIHEPKNTCLIEQSVLYIYVYILLQALKSYKVKVGAEK